MLIHSVRLENIRSYTNEKIDFPEGSTLLSGDIGSGKSTILLAIEFALFGLNKGAGNSLLRHGKKEGSVELNFSVDENNILIKRTLKRSGDEARQSNGYIIINNVKSDLTPVELKSKVIEILGYPEDTLTKKDMIYTYTVYTPQEEMKQILTEDAESRLEILRKVFGIDRYKRIRNNCEILLKDLKEKKANLEGKAEGIETKKQDRESREKEDKELREKIEKINDELEKARKEMFESKTKLKEYETKVYKLNNIKKDVEHGEKDIKEKEELLDDIKEEKNTLAAEIEKIKKKAAEIELIAAPLRTEEDIEKDIREKEQDINDTIKKKELVKEKLSNNATHAKDANQRIEEIQKNIDEHKNKKTTVEEIKREIELLDRYEEEIEKTISLIQEITAKINENKIHILNSHSVIEKITKIDSCPTCMQEVSEMHKRSIIEKENTKTKEHRVDLLNMEELKKEKEELLKRQKLKHTELLKKQSTLERLNAELKRMEEDMKKVETEKRLIITLREERDKLKQEFEKLCSQDIEKQKKIIENFKKMLEIIRSNKIKEKEKSNLKNLAEEKEKRLERIIIQEKSIIQFVIDKKKTVEELKENAKELSGTEEIYNKTKDEFDNKMNEEKKIEVERSSMNNQLFNINKRIEELNKEIAEKENAAKETKKTAELQNWIDEYFITLMSIMEKQIMGNIYWQFNELFQQWFNQLMEDDTINARIDDSFTPIIEQNGYETKIDFLSGGERTSAALAYRLALNKVINKLVSNIRTKDLIILDEPTDGFSTEQLDKVRNVLEELNVKQLILVSHETKIESFVDNVIKINKNEHESRVVA